MFDDIKAAIFDVDGTILDSLSLWDEVPALYLKTLGVDAKPELSKQVFNMTFEEGSSFIKQEYNLSEDVEEIRKGILDTATEQYLSFIQPKDETLKVIRQLKENGVTLTVATSASRHHVEGSFKRLGILDFFEKIFCSSEIGKSKKEPDIYLMAADYMGMKPEETCVFEDALFAIHTAKASGFKTCGVYDDFSKSDWPEIERNADYTLGMPKSDKM